MATITPTVAALEAQYDTHVTMITWASLTSANNVGVAIQKAGSADRTVQISGTFNGATVVLEGSNDGTNYVTLTDPQGNALSKAAAAIESVSEVTRYIRPSTSGGGGSQDITVTLLVRRP